MGPPLFKHDKIRLIRMLARRIPWQGTMRKPVEASQLKVAFDEPEHGWLKLELHAGDHSHIATVLRRVDHAVPTTRGAAVVGATVTSNGFSRMRITAGAG